MSRKPKDKTPRRVPGLQQVTGAAPRVESGGRVWRLGFNAQDAKGRLEGLIRSHVLRAAGRERDEIGGPDGEKHYEAELDRVRRGHYKTMARGWNTVLASDDGATLFLLSLLLEYHPDATADAARALMAAEPDQCVAALEAVAPDFYRAVAVQMGATPGAELDAAIAETARELAAALRPPTPAPATVSA